MTKTQEAVTTFKSGFNCAQAILKTYGPDYGLSDLDSLRISSGFGGGMRRAEVCGAVTGALMVLGLRYGPECASDTSKDAVYDRVEAFTARFEARCGSVLCKDLLGCDISTDEGMGHARQTNLFKTVCPDMVRIAAELLEDLCDANGDPHGRR